MDLRRTSWDSANIMAAAASSNGCSELVSPVGCTFWRSEKLKVADKSAAIEVTNGLKEVSDDNGLQWQFDDDNGLKLMFAVILNTATSVVPQHCWTHRQWGDVTDKHTVDVERCVQKDHRYYATTA